MEWNGVRLDFGRCCGQRYCDRVGNECALAKKNRCISRIPRCQNFNFQRKLLGCHPTTLEDRIKGGHFSSTSNAEDYLIKSSFLLFPVSNMVLVLENRKTIGEQRSEVWSEAALVLTYANLTLFSHRQKEVSSVCKTLHCSSFSFPHILMFIHTSVNFTGLILNTILRVYYVHNGVIGHFNIITILLNWADLGVSFAPTSLPTSSSSASSIFIVVAISLFLRFHNFFISKFNFDRLFPPSSLIYIVFHFTVIHSHDECE